MTPRHPATNDLRRSPDGGEGMVERKKGTRAARAVVGVLMVLGALPLVLFVCLMAAHFGGRWMFDRHVREWADVITREAPPGTSQEDVERLFAGRGIALSCDARGRIATCYGTDEERFGLLPEWFLRFKATFEEGRLVRVEQTALGVGF
ncbi:hypothetical protein [Lysobacter arvi]|uniref:DUF3301 domain-containing protein n=1 Tax=Lysobacter arvi TaxID=3038776 RepID=A0ABU1CCX9_9GAMM|nr:hypothetical protein [Lysobacter arvi]MDR0182259.1 hypothetical protein [Lysobacter arvi]